VKILVLSNFYPPDTQGGYEMGCRQVVDGLRARGHDVRVLTTVPRTPAVSDPHVIRTLQLTDFLWNSYLCERSHRLTYRLAEAASYQINSINVFALLAAIEQVQPDIVYVWMVTGIGGLGLLACLNHLHIPWVWHLMDEVPSTLCMMHDRVFPALARELVRQLRGSVVACSRQLIDRIAQLGVALEGPVAIVPNWVAGPLPPVRSRFYRREAPLRIVAAAAWIDRSYDKGINLLIEAAAILRQRGYHRFSLDIFGKLTDPYYDDLILQHSLRDWVSFRGSLSQSELMVRYQDYDVFAFPARLNEPCAFAPLEAAPGGCVPIMARISGNSEWFVHGVHCLKAPRTAEGFARALGDILDGKIQLEPIGRRVAALVRRDFHLDGLLPRLEQVLAAGAQQSRAGAGTAAEAYRMARLAERLTQVLLQEEALRA
jgi:glycosyltransferase involved in cell wall biosynthesis